ncbi:MAG: carbohydrate ABC transporter permease [Bosea sp. (in: a-proteobacteria)]|jgi:multiple sugar transport system permease protein
MPDRIMRYLLLVPALVIVLGTTLWPLGSAIATSFRNWRLKRSPVPQGWVGLDNYAFAFEEPEFWNALQVTAVFVTLDVVIAVAVSLGLALLLRRAGVLQSLTRAVLILPFAMSPALIGVSFRFMFNGEYGVLAKGIGWLVPPLADVIWLASPGYAMAALILSDVWHWFPYLTLIFLGGLAAVPVETEEAALIDGATAWQTTLLVVLPQIKGVIAVALVLKTIFALKMFDSVQTLTGAGPGITTQTLAHYVYTIGFVHYDMGHASALAIVLTAILVGIGILYTRLVMPPKVIAR